MFPIQALLLLLDYTPITATDLQSLVTALTQQITVANIVGVLAAGLTAVIGIVFAWWGARKLVSMMQRAFKRGKLRL